jgi:hypothetical protein
MPRRVAVYKGHVETFAVPFAFDTPGLCDGSGVPLLWARRGDVVLDQWLSLSVAFVDSVRLELRTAAGHSVGGGSLALVDVTSLDDVRDFAWPQEPDDGRIIVRKDTLLTLHVTDGSGAGAGPPDPLPTQGRGEFGLVVVRSGVSS